MKIREYIDGVLAEREATAEEIAAKEAYEANALTPEPTAEERIADLEEALELLLSGVTE